MSGEPLDASVKRSNSRSHTSRPTTPLRPSSRSSFRESARGAGESDAPFPLNTFEPAFAELSDAMADLEANMMHFQLMHESLARFSESFASFMYGLNMNAFCVDFPEDHRHVLCGEPAHNHQVVQIRHTRSPSVASPRSARSGNIIERKIQYPWSWSRAA
ncbi:hypothetical protein ACHAPT_013020 [Fusarium lateritium]